MAQHLIFSQEPRRGETILGNRWEIVSVTHHGGSNSYTLTARDRHAQGNCERVFTAEVRAPVEKLTKRQAQMIEGYVRYGSPRTYGNGEHVRNMGGAASRMQSDLEARGLLAEYNAERDSNYHRRRAGDDAQPERDPILRTGPTAKGLRALLAHGLTPTESIIGHKREGFKPMEQLRAEIEELIPRLEAAEENDREIMRAWDAAQLEAHDRWSEERRAKRLRILRGIFVEEDIDLGDRTEEQILALAERIAETELVL